MFAVVKKKKKKLQYKSFEYKSFYLRESICVEDKFQEVKPLEERICTFVILTHRVGQK